MAIKSLSVLILLAVVKCAYCQDCSIGDVRLIGGRHSLEGRLEVCAMDLLEDQIRWGTVCNDDWNLPDAQTVCRQLGIQGDNLDDIVPYVYYDITTDSNSTFLINNVECVGNETSIINCTHNDLPICIQSSEEVGVICSPPDTPECVDNEVRIVDSTGETAEVGLVQVCIGESWGTICQSRWDDSDAEVVCRQLGVSPSSPRALTLSGSPTDGVSSLPIVYSEVSCTGMEGRVVDCPRLSEYVELCTHSNDAGVNCTATGFGSKALPMSVAVITVLSVMIMWMA